MFMQLRIQYLDNTINLTYLLHFGHLTFCREDEDEDLDSFDFFQEKMT